MTATIHAHPSALSVRAEEARKVAEHLIMSVEAMRPDTELAIGGLLQAAFHIATHSTADGVAPKAARSLRVLADLIETVTANGQVH